MIRLHCISICLGSGVYWVLGEIDLLYFVNESVKGSIDFVSSSVRELLGSDILTEIEGNKHGVGNCVCRVGWK